MTLCRKLIGMSTTTTPTHPSAGLSVSGLPLYDCPEPGCMIFPSTDPADIDAHLAAGNHVFAADLANIHVRSAGVSIDPPARNGNGVSAGGSVSGPPATDKQLAFLRRLIAEHPATADVENFHLDRITSFSKREASAAITVLMNADDAPAAAPAEFRWTKIDGEWLVTGPTGAHEGDTITIAKASGEKVEAVITGDAGNNRDGGPLWRVRKVAAPGTSNAPRPGNLRAAMFALKDRVVELTGSQTRDRCLRVCVPAHVLGVDDQPDAAYLISWAYAWKGAERHTGGVGSIRKIEVSEASAVKLVEFLLAATPDEFTGYQAAYGQHFHACGRCGSPLTDKDSKARGLGPTCYGASA